MTGDPPDLEVAVPVATVWSAPDAAREADAPALWDRPDPVAWTAALDAAGRTGLVGRTVTQGLLGEPVRVRAERGEWVEVRLPWQQSSLDPDGYPGWVRRSHLAEPVPRQDPAGAAGTAYVVASWALLQVDDGAPVAVSRGTALRCESGAGAPGAADGPGAETVLLPGGRRGRLPGAAVRRQAGVDPPETTGERVLAAARTFLGLRYLWGGLSVWGLDCSGLVHLTLRSLGRAVPRDAHDQRASAVAVADGDVRPGDLLFFGAGRVTHVGLVSDRNGPGGSPLMLHAPERDGGGLVEEAALDARRRETLLGKGRPAFLA